MNEMILVAARVQCVRDCTALGIDYHLMWEKWGERYLEDAKAVVEAIHAPWLLEALQELADAARKAQEDLNTGIPEGEPVHPVSARLTWPISTALLAIDKATNRSGA